MNTTAALKYEVLGSNDAASHCECCGRQGLRRVVWMRPLDEDGNAISDPIPFGRVCAAKAAGWTYGTTGDIDRKVAKLAVETHEKYLKLCSKAVGALEWNQQIKAERLAYGYDVRGGFHRKGLIYVLPGDVIVSMSDADQVIELPAAKARLQAAYPVCKYLDRACSTDELRSFIES